MAVCQPAHVLVENQVQTSIFGHLLPESQQDFEEIKYPRNLTCSACRKLFSNANTHTALGWKETQISGFCEDCFDALFAEE